MKNIILKLGVLLTFITNFMILGMQSDLVTEFDSGKPNSLMKKFVENPFGGKYKELLNLLDLIKESNPESALTAQSLLQAEIDLILQANPQKFAQFEEARYSHYKNKMDEYKRSGKYKKIENETLRINTLDKKLPSNDQLDKDIIKLDQDLKKITENLETLEKQFSSLINIKKPEGSIINENIEQENKKISQENKKIQDQINELEQQIKDLGKSKKKK